MFVTLQVKSGAARGTKAVVREGQVLQVGRTEWADFAVEGDASMGEIHFSLECQADGCRLRDLKSGQPTSINGEEVAEDTMLADGDEIRAGRTTFTIAIEGMEDRSALVPAAELAAAAAADLEAEEQKGPQDSGFARVEVPAAAVLAADIQLTEDAEALLNEDLCVREYFEALVAAELFPDALTVLAHGLGKQEAVWWCLAARGEAAVSTGSKLHPVDDAAWQAAEAWVRDPSEEARSASGEAAVKTGMETPGGWAAHAAFCSSGSMLPADLPPLPPPPEATGQAATTSLMLSTTAGDGTQLTARYQATLKQGAAIADGNQLWEEAE